MTERALTFVEIDIDYCSRTYGSAPCAAALGVTGSKKCFNTFATCQDKTNYDNDPLTLRYTYASGYTGDIVAIQSLTEAQHSPGRIDIGESIGERASVRCSFDDHRHSDIDLDPYLSDRAYDPLTQGTYWGRFVARNKFLIGRPLRTYVGYKGQALSEMEERHYVIESISGPNLAGQVSIVAKDPLRLASGDAGQAPAASTGQLASAITSGAGSATLSPTGVGDSEYPASGKVAIGDEIISFTRSGDVLTLTGRGVNNTEADAHDADETVQLVLEFSSEAPAVILETLLVTYAGVSSSLIPVSEWTANDTLYVGRNYSGVIARPTAVRDLVSELLQQVGASMWWDELGQLIRYEPLRTFSTPPSIDDDCILANTYGTRAQPEKRLSQVWTYYGRINPLEDEDEPNNYAGVAVTIEPTAETENEYGRPAIRKIFSRWISSSARSAALEINAKLLARRRDPPRLIQFAVPRFLGMDYEMGDTVSLRNRATQNDEGEPEAIPAQVISVGSTWSRLDVLAEEFTFTEQELPGGGAGGGGGLNPVRGLDLVVDEANVNIRTKYDVDYADPDDLLQSIDSVSTGADTITIAGHGYAEDARVILSGGTAPAPLVLGTVYYVVNPTTDTFQLSATEGGSAINLTTSTATSSVRFVIDVPVIVDPSVQIYSQSTGLPALDVGAWAEGGVNITLTVRTGAYITGAGGNGGAGGQAGGNGSAGGSGGVGLYTRQAVTVDNSGTIQGGGGGGGGGGSAGEEVSPGEFIYASGGFGGGGGGRDVGTAGGLGSNGSLTAGGAGGAGGLAGAASGGTGGAGGAPGDAGPSGSAGSGGDVQGSGGTGGAAGNAVDGDSFVTFSTLGTIEGARTG